jgi:hypothetical protein
MRCSHHTYQINLKKIWLLPGCENLDRCSSSQSMNGISNPCVIYAMGGNTFRDLLDVADIIILARGNQHPPVHHDGWMVEWT